MKKEFYVQIKKARWKIFWYNDFIGHIFLVKENLEDDTTYALINESGWIDKADCTVVDVHHRDFTVEVINKWS